MFTSTPSKAFQIDAHRKALYLCIGLSSYADLHLPPIVCVCVSNRMAHMQYHLIIDRDCSGQQVTGASLVRSTSAWRRARLVGLDRRVNGFRARWMELDGSQSKVARQEAVDWWANSRKNDKS